MKLCLSAGLVHAARSWPVWCRLNASPFSSPPMSLSASHTHFLCLCMSHRTLLLCVDVSLKTAAQKERSWRQSSYQTQTKSCFSDGFDTRLFNSSSSSLLAAWLIMIQCGGSSSSLSGMCFGCDSELLPGNLHEQAAVQNAVSCNLVSHVEKSIALISAGAPFSSCSSSF